MIDKEQLFKYRVKLSNSDGKLIHHEVRCIIKNALFASGLKYAQNKSWPMMFFGPQFAEVFKTECEFVDICLLQNINVDDIKQKLNTVLPPFIQVQTVQEMPCAFSSVEKLAMYAVYNIKGLSFKEVDALKNIKAEVSFTHPNGIRTVVDIKKYIKEIEAIGSNEIKIITQINIAGSLGLKQVLLMLLGLEVGDIKAEIVRSALLWQDSAGNYKAV